MVSVRIRLMRFTSKRFRIHGAKPVCIHAGPEPDPGQTLPSHVKKLPIFFMKYKAANRSYKITSVCTKAYFERMEVRFDLFIL